ncbi:hypothetical protein Gotur_028940, partial [Gossypium turneri]
MRQSLTCSIDLIRRLRQFRRFWSHGSTVISGNYLPLKDIVATPRRDDISEEKWVAILQNLHEEDVEW